MAWSFNALLRQHLRDHDPIDRDRALLLLHAHFGDRPGAAFGRAALLQTLVDMADSEASPSRPGLRMTADARDLLQRACGVRPLYLPEGSEFAAALRKTDLALGPDAGLRSVVGC